MELTSIRNPLLQKVRRAAAHGRPTDDGLIVAEGPLLLSEAQRGRWTVVQVFVTPQARERYAQLFHALDAPVIQVSDRALASAAATDTPQNILTLLRPCLWSWRDLLPRSSLLVVLDRLQDPGNVGTILRCAEAFGASGVVFLRGCARASNGKLLRAAAGSLFRLPFLEDIDAQDFLQHVQSARLQLYALTAGGETPVARADWRPACALLVGSEGSGVSPELLARAERVSIPTAHVESLNAAVACSIALYQARQQRQSA